jgi:hypothetical protein
MIHVVQGHYKYSWCSQLVAWLTPAACLVIVPVISDLRGLEMILDVPSAPARHACFYCWINGFRACNKTIYCGHHALLPPNHPLRPILAALMDKHVAATPSQGAEAVPANNTQPPPPRTSAHLKQGMSTTLLCSLGGVGGQEGLTPV